MKLDRQRFRTFPSYNWFFRSQNGEDYAKIIIWKTYSTSSFVVFCVIFSHVYSRSILLRLCSPIFMLCRVWGDVFMMMFLRWREENGRKIVSFHRIRDYTVALCQLGSSLWILCLIRATKFAHPKRCFIDFLSCLCGTKGLQNVRFLQIGRNSAYISRNF